MNDCDHDCAIVRELRAEIERLRTQCGGNCRYWEGRWRDEKAKNDRLEKEIERLRALLRPLVNMDAEPDDFEAARNALERK